MYNVRDGMSTDPREKGAVIPSGEVWDPWLGHPPADERLKNAFNKWKDNPEARTVIDRILAFGRRLNDASLGEARPSRDDFEDFIDELTTKPEGEFLLENHPALGGKNLAVIRWAVDGVVGGKPVGYRSGGDG